MLTGERQFVEPPGTRSHGSESYHRHPLAMLPCMSSRRGGIITTFAAAVFTTVALSSCANSVDGEAVAERNSADTPGTTTSSTPAPSTPTPTTGGTEPSSKTGGSTIRPVDPAAYASSTPGVYYFLTDDNMLECAILLDTEPSAGCQGEMPPNVPRAPGAGAPDVRVPANSAVVTSTGEGEFVSIGDIKYMDPSRSAVVLPADSALTAGPFTCSVVDAAVTCETAEHGFTVSPDDFDVW